jgi:hypothetical protein
MGFLCWLPAALKPDVKRPPGAAVPQRPLGWRQVLHQANELADQGLPIGGVRGNAQLERCTCWYLELSCSCLTNHASAAGISPHPHN